MTTDEKHIDNWNKKTKNLGAVKVVYITNNLVDLFLSDGWNNQVRIKLNRKEKSFSFSDPRQRNNSSLHRIISNILREL